MEWFFLFLAGFFEIVFGLSLKLMDNHRHILWTIVFYISMFLSFYFLNLSTKAIPISTAYALWTGIGIAGISTFGILFLNEPISLYKALFTVLLLVSIVGLKVVS